jgi:Putative restriction endonuclease
VSGLCTRVSGWEQLAALRMNEQQTELQPDIVVGRDEHFTDRDLPVAPLLAVEVLSPSTRLIDLNLKKAAYERMGVPSYWTVDPASVTLTAFEMDARCRCGQVARVCGEAEFVTALPFPFRVRPADLLRRGTAG